MPQSGLAVGTGADEGPLLRRRRAAIVAPLLLMGTMYPAFRLMDADFGEAVHGYLGWFLGLAVYWVVWGAGFSLWVLGAPRIRELIRPRRPTLPLAGLVAFPLAMAAVFRFLVPGMGYDKPSAGVVLLLLSTAFGNGIFEELLWRGVYLHLFRGSLFLGVVWPSVWFGLWHLVPTNAENLGMVIGPTLFGFYLAFLARRTGSIWWPIQAHVLGGLVMLS
jgi:membrane protease YdiL (CAAX protease family)